MADPRKHAIGICATDDEQKHAWLEQVKRERGLKLRPAWPTPRGEHRRIVIERVAPVARPEAQRDAA